MQRGRAWRIATGAMLLAAGASRLLPPATNYFLLAFGGALFGASLAAPSGSVGELHKKAAQQPAEGSTPVLVARPPSVPMPIVTPLIAPGALACAPRLLMAGERSYRRERMLGVLAILMLLGAGALVAYPWLTHRNSVPLQASSGGSSPSNTLGRAIAPRVDPQLHLIALGQAFVLNKANVTIGAAGVCRSGGNVLVDVPAAIRKLGDGQAISEPEYQLLDSHGVPHQPLAAVPLDLNRGSSGHAIPPPSVYRESLQFQLPVASARGALKLQAVLASGSGPEYRVTVADTSHQLGPSIGGGKATCVSPGGQGA